MGNGTRRFRTSRTPIGEVGVLRRNAYCELLSAAFMLIAFDSAVQAEPRVACHLEPNRLSRFTPAQRAILAKINHVDAAHLPRLRRLLVPNRWEPGELAYSPMPHSVAELAQERKALIVDIPSQVFGAYEHGELVRWGPVSTGARYRETPAGTYHLNWQSRRRISSVDPTWIMPWYFNFSATIGLGLHQYSLPGRPASHGCTRLLETDARWLFAWGEGWTIDPDTRAVIREGTLVIMLGEYDFTRPQPWLRPDWWTRGVTLPLQQIAARK